MWVKFLLYLISVDNKLHLITEGTEVNQTINFIRINFKIIIIYYSFIYSRYQFLDYL